MKARYVTYPSSYYAGIRIVEEPAPGGTGPHASRGRYWLEKRSRDVMGAPTWSLVFTLENYNDGPTQTIDTHLLRALFEAAMRAPEETGP